MGKKKRKVFREGGDHQALHLYKDERVNRVLRLNFQCVCVWGGDSHTAPSNSPESAEYSTIQLRSDAIYLEIASDPICLLVVL